MLADAPVIPTVPALIKTAEIVQITGMCARTIIRWSQIGRDGFPRPMGTGRHKRWRRADILRWLRGDAQAEGAVNGK